MAIKVKHEMNAAPAAAAALAEGRARRSMEAARMFASGSGSGGRGGGTTGARASALSPGGAQAHVVGAHAPGVTDWEGTRRENAAQEAARAQLAQQNNDAAMARLNQQTKNQIALNEAQADLARERELQQAKDRAQPNTKPKSPAPPAVQSPFPNAAPNAADVPEPTTPNGPTQSSEQRFLVDRFEDGFRIEDDPFSGRQNVIDPSGRRVGFAHADENPYYWDEKRQMWRQVIPGQQDSFYLPWERREYGGLRRLYESFGRTAFGRVVSDAADRYNGLIKQYGGTMSIVSDTIKMKRNGGGPPLPAAQLTTYTQEDIDRENAELQKLLNDYHLKNGTTPQRKPLPAAQPQQAPVRTSSLAPYWKPDESVGDSNYAAESVVSQYGSVIMRSYASERR